MKKIIYVLMLAVFVGFSVNNAGAQKKTTEVACYKSNMDCVNCEKTISEYLKFEKGVKGLKVDHVSNTILIEYKEGKNSSEGYAKAIKKKGYKAEKISLEDYEKLTEKTNEKGNNPDQKQKENK